MVHYLMGRYQVSERRAVRAARFCLSSIRYQSGRDPLTALRQRLRELAQTRVRFGYRRLLVLLRREGWELGKKRCYRLYTEEGLALRRKRPWRHAKIVLPGLINTHTHAPMVLYRGLADDLAGRSPASCSASTPCRPLRMPPRSPDRGGCGNTVGMARVVRGGFWWGRPGWRVVAPGRPRANSGPNSLNYFGF